MNSRYVRLIIACSIVSMSFDSPARGQEGWGTIKGKVVWAGAAAPNFGNVNVTKDQGECLKQGPIADNVFQVDAKTNGVSNVVIWLRAKDDDTVLKVHKDLESPSKEKVVIDRPCCMFEPRVVVMRAGQILVVKNSSAIGHSAMMVGRANSFNLAIAASGSLEKEMKAERKPVDLTCASHGWMKGLIGVFDHPYFFLTKAAGEFELQKAPAGNLRLFIFHQKTGWLNKNG